MIDINSERLESLADLSRWEKLPRRRGGRRVHISTLHRWALRGCRGVRLEVARVGGTLCSSRDALARFFERLSALDRQPAVELPPTPSHRDAAIRRAERELNAA